MKTLMIAGLAGDSDAYRQLLQAVAERLRIYYARRVGAHCTDLEDLVQETLIAVHRRRVSYDRTLPFTSWLHAIARYKLIDHLRKQRVRKHVPLEAERQMVAADDFQAFLAAADVEQLLEGLSEKCRQSIRLTRIEGYSVAEAATMTGLSRSGVKVSVHRGIRGLMALVKGGHADD